MRMPTKAAVAASTALGAGAAVVAAGRIAAGRALGPASQRGVRGGSTPVPAGFEEQLTVHARSVATPPQVALTRSLTAELPGTYGLTGRYVHAVVGHVMHEATHTAPADTVVRRLYRVARGSLATGDTVRLTPVLHEGSPRDALGAECRDVEIDVARGRLPAWYVPGDRRTWVVTAHGLGATRAQAMNVLPLMQRMRVPVLMPARRGDPGAPRRPDGVGHLGAHDWRDLAAAVHFAKERGAARVLLYGWSTGASTALRTAEECAGSGDVTGLVLDSPVLDPDATLRALASVRGVPGFLLPLAVRAAEGRAGARRTERHSAPVDPDRLPVPALVVHGPDDAIAPWGTSREFAERRPDLVTEHVVARAPHAAMWNANPEGYEEALSRFLMPLL